MDAYVRDVLHDRPAFYAPLWDRAGTSGRELTRGKHLTLTSPSLGWPGLRAGGASSMLFASGRFGQYATDPDTGFTAGVGLECWFIRNAAAPASYGYLVSRQQTGQYGIGITATNNRFAFLHYNIAWYESTFVPALGVPYHLVAILLGQALTLVVNGTVVHTATIAAAMTLGAGPGDTDIGNSEGVLTTAYAPGYLSDAAIYPSLSLARARAHHRTGKALWVPDRLRRAA